MAARVLAVVPVLLVLVLAAVLLEGPPVEPVLMAALAVVLVLAVDNLIRTFLSG